MRTYLVKYVAEMTDINIFVYWKKQSSIVSSILTLKRKNKQFA